MESGQKKRGAEEVLDKRTGQDRQKGDREDRRQARSELSYALPKTIPVMVGYLVLGMAYGILMKVNGFGIGWTAAMSIFVYAGSLQYVGITFLAAGVHPAYALIMGLMINARHLFYGISMLGRYQGTGKVKPYLIFALTDETFSVVCNEEPPEGLSREMVFFWISFLDQLYWIAGSLAGAVLGTMISFDTTGMDFALTALFVVIFIEQWEGQKEHWPALTGVLASAACLWVFGAESFIIPSMVLISVVIALSYRRGKDRKEEPGYGA